MSERRDALVRSFAWRLPLCSDVEVEQIEETLAHVEHERDLAERYTFFDAKKDGPATTAKIEREYRRAKSVEIDVSDLDDRDPRDVVGDGIVSTVRSWANEIVHAPDAGIPAEVLSTCPRCNGLSLQVDFAAFAASIGDATKLKQCELCDGVGLVVTHAPDGGES